MALGAGYPETGSVNKSAIHWDMICDVRQDAEVRMDGEVVVPEWAFRHLRFDKEKHPEIKETKKRGVVTPNRVFV